MATRERFLIEIAGKEAADLYPDVTEVQATLDDDLGATFRIELSMTLAADGTWSYTDDDRFAPWTQVSVQVGFDDGPVPLVSGYLTGTHTSFEADPGRCKVELLGSDASALLDRSERLRSWSDKTDSDIATDIFAEYGVTPVVDATDVVHEANVSTVVQRETDLQFLRRLALRNGYECFIEDNTGYFRKPLTAAPPQGMLAVQFGAATNVVWFGVRVEAQTPGDIGMFQIDRADKTVLSAVASSSGLPALGADGRNDLVPDGIPKARAYVAMSSTTGLREMDTLCQSIYDRGEWFVTGEGVVDGNRYGDVLRPRRSVTIKGVGERHSGVYSVTHVVHTISAGGYAQRFVAKRNGLRPTGKEDFSGAGSLLQGLGI
jgi:phage protein D